MKSSAAGQASSRPQLTLWQTEWCPASRRVRQRLTELSLDVVLHQVPVEHEERVVLLLATGTTTIPVLVADDETIVGEEACDSIVIAPEMASANDVPVKQHREYRPYSVIVPPRSKVCDPRCHITFGSRRTFPAHPLGGKGCTGKAARGEGQIAYCSDGSDHTVSTPPNWVYSLRCAKAPTTPSPSVGSVRPAANQSAAQPPMPE